VEAIAYKQHSISLWDVGGQDNIRPLWKHHIHNTAAVFFVVDSCDRERMGLARRELHRMMVLEELDGAALLVWANKQDMESAIDAAEISQLLGLEELADIRTGQWNLQPCSAATGEGLYPGISWYVQTLGPNHSALRR
jgi:ADP-ribosylation factor protein 1